MDMLDENKVTEPNKIGKTIWLVLLALCGLALSVKLAFIYYYANFTENAMPSFCAINNVINCDDVAQSRYSQFLGIPLALYGVFLYTFVIFMCFVDKLQNIKLLSFLKVFKNKFAYIYTLYCISFAISMILTGVQFFLIGKFCILCFITYLVDLISLLIAKDRTKSFLYEFKTSVLDFWEGIKVKGNLIAIIILFICAAGVLTYTKTSYILAPHVEQMDEFEYFANVKGNPFNAHGNSLGNPDGNIIIYEYSDFKCPMCPIMNRMLQKAAGEYENIFIIHYNMPLDNECNPALKRPFHVGSCQLAKYAIASQKQDKYWDMINILFEKKPKNGKEIRKAAKAVGIDETQLANDYINPNIEKMLLFEIYTGLTKGVDATPTIFINGKKYSGIMSYEKLKSTLEENGAVLKQK